MKDKDIIIILDYSNPVEPKQCIYYKDFTFEEVVKKGEILPGDDGLMTGSWRVIEDKVDYRIENAEGIVEHWIWERDYYGRAIIDAMIDEQLLGTGKEE